MIVLRKILSDLLFHRVLKAVSTEIYSGTFQPILANTITLLQLNMEKNLHISKTNLISLSALNCLL